MLLALWSGFLDEAYWAQGPTPDAETTGGLPHYIDPFTQRYLLEYKQAKERQRIKEEEIIRLRVEAQETLLRKRELEEKKRTAEQQRRLSALEAQYIALQDELQAQLVALAVLHKNAVKRRNNLILVLLQAASPFSPITFH
jgi:hypothetical protein